ncbi:hypothetical protein DB347_23445 [Opitutaceae bacterium EW11]|nr:hypothetical protein DB347_23445 [Opitutaceae bacterium EW11]
MKTVATFSKPFEAHLLIGRLEGSGVHAFARDENFVTLDWLYSNAIGGVKVDVSDEDYERAMDILKEGEESKPPSENKAKPLGRYIAIFAVTFLISFIYLLVLLGGFASGAVAGPLIASVLIALVVSAACAALKI